MVALTLPVQQNAFFGLCPDKLMRLQANCQDLRYSDVIPKWHPHHHSPLCPVPGHFLTASGAAQYHRFHHFWPQWCYSSADAVPWQ